MIIRLLCIGILGFGLNQAIPIKDFGLTTTEATTEDLDLTGTTDPSYDFENNATESSNWGDNISETHGVTNATLEEIGLGQLSVSYELEMMDNSSLLLRLRRKDNDNLRISTTNIRVGGAGNVDISHLHLVVEKGRDGYYDNYVVKDLLKVGEKRNFDISSILSVLSKGERRRNKGSRRNKQSEKKEKAEKSKEEGGEVEEEEEEEEEKEKEIKETKKTKGTTNKKNEKKKDQEKKTEDNTDEGEEEEAETEEKIEREEKKKVTGKKNKKKNEEEGDEEDEDQKAESEERPEKEETKKVTGKKNKKKNEEEGDEDDEDQKAETEERAEKEEKKKVTAKKNKKKNEDDGDEEDEGEKAESEEQIEKKSGEKITVGFGMRLKKGQKVEANAKENEGEEDTEQTDKGEKEILIGENTETKKGKKAENSKKEEEEEEEEEAIEKQNKKKDNKNKDDNKKKEEEEDKKKNEEEEENEDDSDDTKSQTRPAKKGKADDSKSGGEDKEDNEDKENEDDKDKKVTDEKDKTKNEGEEENEDDSDDTKSQTDSAKKGKGDDSKSDKQTSGKTTKKGSAKDGAGADEDDAEYDNTDDDGSIASSSAKTLAEHKGPRKSMSHGGKNPNSQYDRFGPIGRGGSNGGMDYEDYQDYNDRGGYGRGSMGGGYRGSDPSMFLESGLDRLSEQFDRRGFGHSNMGYGGSHGFGSNYDNHGLGYPSRMDDSAGMDPMRSGNAQMNMNSPGNIPHTGAGNQNIGNTHGFGSNVQGGPGGIDHMRSGNPLMNMDGHTGPGHHPNNRMKNRRFKNAMTKVSASRRLSRGRGNLYKFSRSSAFQANIHPQTARYGIRKVDAEHVEQYGRDSFTRIAQATQQNANDESNNEDIPDITGRDAISAGRQLENNGKDVGRVNKGANQGFQDRGKSNFARIAQAAQEQSKDSISGIGDLGGRLLDNGKDAASFNKFAEKGLQDRTKETLREVTRLTEGLQQAKIKPVGGIQDSVHRSIPRVGVPTIAENSAGIISNIGSTRLGHAETIGNMGINLFAAAGGLFKGGNSGGMNVAETKPDAENPFKHSQSVDPLLKKMMDTHLKTIGVATTEKPVMENVAGTTSRSDVKPIIVDTTPGSKLESTTGNITLKNDFKTTDTITSPKRNLQSTDDTTTPKISLKSVDDATTPKVSLKSVEDATTPKSSLKSTDDATTPKISLKSIDDATTPKSSLKSVDDDTTPKVSLKSVNDATTPKSSFKSTDDTTSSKISLKSVDDTITPKSDLKSTNDNTTPKISHESTDTKIQPSSNLGSTKFNFGSGHNFKMNEDDDDFTKEDNTSDESEETDSLPEDYDEDDGNDNGETEQEEITTESNAIGSDADENAYEPILEANDRIIRSKEQTIDEVSKDSLFAVQPVENYELKQLRAKNHYCTSSDEINLLYTIPQDCCSAALDCEAYGPKNTSSSEILQRDCACEISFFMCLSNHRTLYDVHPILLFTNDMCLIHEQENNFNLINIAAYIFNPKYFDRQLTSKNT